MAQPHCAKFVFCHILYIMPLIRLNKYLASQGVASRRKIDDFTSHGRITINGKTAVLGDKVNPETDTVVVDKKIINPVTNNQNLVYYLLNKPKFVLSTAHDGRGRDTVMNYVPSSPRVFPVGRLDYESTGLIILTNDGDLAFRLTHPRFHFPKTYLVTVVGHLAADKISQLGRGISLEDGRTAPAKVEVLPSKLNQHRLKITLYEGKKRQIRRMCSFLHLHVVDLQRLSIGHLGLENLQPGDYRCLTPADIALFK